MRVYVVAIQSIILGLQWSPEVSAEKNDDSPLCTRTREGLTREQADKFVGPWAERQYNEYIEWNTTQTGPGDEFWHWLYKRWAPDTADSILDCKLSKLCSPVTCHLIDDKHDLQDQWSAYWTLETVAKFHNMAYEIREANQQAWSSAQSNVGTLMARFSDGSNIEAHKLQHDKHWKLASHVINGVAMLISTLGIFVAAALALAAKTTVIIAGTIVKVDAIRIIAASAGLFNSGATVALNFGTDVMGAKDYVSKVTNTLADSQKQNHDRIVDRFDAYVNGLFDGHDPNLTRLIQQGGYINTTRVLTPEHNKQLNQRWTASYVSSIWNLEGTYIVMANTRNCDSDSRGFKGLRVCLEEAPQYVFYTFSKSIVREGTNHKALIRGPIGHANLESATGFTLTDVVRASFVYSQHHGYSANSGAPEGSENLMDGFFGPTTAEAGGKAHGLFNLPILYSPGGQAISSINTRANRNYPCMAARLPWSKDDSHKPQSLQGRAVEWTDNDPATMLKFLKATGFYRSGDWWGYCHGSRHHHGNHCRGDKSIDWTSKFGTDRYKKIRHPFKNCKARKGHGNSFMGCERPNNNGYDKNKPGDCGGKQLAEEFVASDTQWLNATALEAGDMEEDEGELSDWTDGEDDGDDHGDEADTNEDDDSTLRGSNNNNNKTGITSRFHA
ncbi:hypothetical protein E4T52_12167 [Aureobasidium sp. EXF-3400]|nr:hypothetical protein E4T51_08410 [Aureobasidium sp. EXF-12344]KAI4772851.1 hypothetical protein E4T52_12167 [Aureobasidium sp. EXF-3400]